MAVTVYATVATASPPTVYFDGDGTNKVPVRTLLTLTAGWRVRVEVPGRGLKPIVQGQVT
jgi:hypothetical protein